MKEAWDDLVLPRGPVNLSSLSEEKYEKEFRPTLAARLRAPRAPDARTAEVRFAPAPRLLQGAYCQGFMRAIPPALSSG